MPSRHCPLALIALLAAATAAAQQTPAAGDSLATLTIRVAHDSLPLEGVVVRSGRVGAPTDAGGVAVLRLGAGSHAVISARLGFRPDTTRLLLRAGQDTAIAVRLQEQTVEIEAVIVSATRAERRVEDTPLRVEVIDEEEVAEKVAMTPGDIAMMLNETSGLRVQTTSPSLGGASVRVQGLRGRYTLLLADGLPLYGGQSGGLGLLQIPPVDLGRVEVIKGTASALYGSSALGGVINLLSRRPTEASERTALLNGTTRGGTDAVLFGSGPLSQRWGYTALGGAHRQRRNDLDGDGWTDMAGYDRLVVRPRLYFADDSTGRSAFLTAGFTAEAREGGTLGGRVTPLGLPHAEGLRTRRADVGGLSRWILRGTGPVAGSVVTVRGSAVEQRHRHQFGELAEHDRHRTGFAEAAVAVPRGRTTWVAGAAFQRELYRATKLPQFDYDHSIPALFAQLDLDAAAWASLSASARLDAHSEYGTFVNPRISLLLRRPEEGAAPAGWTARLSGGTGAFAPTPFTDETEATGLTPLAPLRDLVAERAASASVDVGGPLATPLGRLELNATAFGSRIRRPVLVRWTTPPLPPIALANATLPTISWGTDAFARLRIDDVLSGELGVIGTYVYLRSTEEDPDRAGVRRPVPLTPRHSAGLDLIWEAEGRGRAGLELYYTGRQSLDDNPYRSESRPYLIVGLLAERVVETRAGELRLFVNGENLTDVRQTRVDPLVRPSPGPGGRWTTDVWSMLEGRTVNAGVRAKW